MPLWVKYALWCYFRYWHWINIKQIKKIFLKPKTLTLLWQSIIHASPNPIKNIQNRSYQIEKQKMKKRKKICMFLDLFRYLLFFRTLQHVREKKMIDTRLSLTKKCFSIVFISFHSIPYFSSIREVLRQICSAGATNFTN